MVDWWITVGAGAIWLGGQILWVAPLPRLLRKGKVATADKGSAEAFGLFWLDQYGWIGLTLFVLGVAGTTVGVIR